MPEAQKPRNIRAFFAEFAKPSKRPATEKVDADRRRSKSPRLSSAPTQQTRDDEAPRRRSIVDLTSSQSTDSESENEKTPEMPAPAVDRLSSSLSGPGSSFTATQSSRSQIASSQRVVRNGEVVVTNSDEDDDSGSAVEDLDELLGLFKPKEPTKPTLPSSPSEASEGDTIYVRPQTRTQPSEERGLKRHFRVDHSVKSRRMLHDLVAKTNRERAVAEGRREAMSAINESNTRVHELEAKISGADVATTLDPTALASMMGDNAEGSDYDKLVQAVKRTEALQSRLEWSFFGDQTPDLNLAHRPPQAFTKLLGNRRYVEAAMANGFLDDLIASGNIQADEESLEWTLVAALTSPGDDLFTTYSKLVTQTDAEKYLNEDWIWRLFSLMGASWDALDETTTVKPQIRLGATPERDPRDWPRVLRILNILRCSSSNLPREVRRKALRHLCRLALDVEVGLHHGACVAIQQTIDTLLDAIPSDTIDEELSTLITDICQQIPHARFRTNLLQALLGPSPHTFILRHRLALAFFLENAVEPTTPDTDLLSRVTAHLDAHPSFQISSATDFSRLAALIDTLDIAVGDGRSEEGSDGDSDASADANATAAAFDRRVDRLADRIRSLATRIRDAGAAHLSRTEAKESLDALHARLLYAVRLQPRLKRSIFGASATLGSAGLGSESIMERFIQRSGKSRIVQQEEEGEEEEKAENVVEFDDESE